MKCPRCETTPLRAEQLSGLSVDACPDCQGIWVRRRDLESLIGGEDDNEDSRQAGRGDERRPGGHDNDDDRFGGLGEQGQQKGKKKGGWLQNIGDMFGGD